MKRYFEKFELFITLFLIITYILVNYYCMNNFGLTDYRSVLLNFSLVLLIIIFIIKNKLGDYYGLTSFPKPSKFLYFIPLVLISLVNFINGIVINNSVVEIIYFILSMVCIGFLEEIIFRGFLFKMMEKDNIKRAVIISSLTFGVGHIINLLNGAFLIPTLIQIIYATCGGFMFVVLFIKSKSLWPSIITHILVNSFSIFNNVDNVISLYIVPIFLIVVSLSYSIYLIKKV